MESWRPWRSIGSRCAWRIRGFAGYISEKIFDCFFAGTVPLYLGAPDIEDYIPADTFIDLRQFRELRRARALPRRTGRSRACAATSTPPPTFLNSPAYARFSQERFAADMVDALRSLPER